MKAPLLGTATAVLLSSVASLALPSLAEAAESGRGPAYIEGHLLGGTLAFGSFEGISVSGASFATEIHGGYHLSGRHDGFVIGATQKLALGTAGAGATLARLGYDVAIPIGRRELTIAPFGFGGLYYGFSGEDPAAHFGFGVEARFFPVEKREAEAGAVVVEVLKRVVVTADRIEIREKIQFKPNEAVIESVSFSLLDEIASVIKRNPQIKKLRIEGHASSEGDAAVNEKLSDSRARAVRDHLVSRGGVSADLLEAKGFGAKNAIAGNDSEEGREKNRRVEFNIVEQTATVERLEQGKVSAKGGGEGLFIVVKPFELGFVTGTPLITTLSFQAGLGYAF
jgi:outer membrane protein OmpA-like peptidoglycan-associated protein